MNTTLLVILGGLAVINIISFFVMVVDKESSRRGHERISEGALFFLGSFFWRNRYLFRNVYSSS